MPDLQAHLKAAEANRRTLDFIQQHVTHHSPWVVTIAFYTALHVVEAVLANDDIHQDKHENRHQLLKRTKKYQHIWKHYQPLFNDSMVARYLTSSSQPGAFSCFSDYLSPKSVISTHVNHNLAQVIKSAGTLLGDPAILASVSRP